MGSVENGYTWKVTTIGDTPIVHLHDYGRKCTEQKQLSWTTKNSPSKGYKDVKKKWGLTQVPTESKHFQFATSAIFD